LARRSRRHLKEAVVDGGPEFKRAFHRTCRRPDAFVFSAPDGGHPAAASGEPRSLEPGDGSV
jgi:hypothetical protein